MVGPASFQITFKIPSQAVEQTFYHSASIYSSKNLLRMNSVYTSFLFTCNILYGILSAED